MDGCVPRPGLLRLCRQRSDRYRQRDHRRHRGDPRHPSGRGRCAADDDRAGEGPLRAVPRASPATRPMVRRICWAGWWTNRASSRIDKSKRTDGTFSREDFRYDRREDRYVCPNGKELKRYRQAGRRAKAKPPEDRDRSDLHYLQNLTRKANAQKPTQSGRLKLHITTMPHMTCLYSKNIYNIIKLIYYFVH